MKAKTTTCGHCKATVTYTKSERKGDSTAYFNAAHFPIAFGLTEPLKPEYVLCGRCFDFTFVEMVHESPPQDNGRGKLN
jgi:hypothetical protein